MRKVIEVPTSLEDVKLVDFVKFASFESEIDELVIGKAIQCFVGLDEKEARSLPANVVQDLYSDILKLLQSDCEAKTIYNIDGRRFGRIPNLDEVTFGEFVDLDTYLKIDEEGKPDFSKVLKWMGVLYRPIEDQHKSIYNIEPYETADMYLSLIKQLPASAFIGSMVFFWTLRKDLQTVTKHYIQLAESYLRNEKHLATSTDGMEASINSLKAILDAMKPLPQYDYTKLLPSYPMKPSKTK